jgi:hypothetical protein
MKRIALLLALVSVLAVAAAFVGTAKTSAAVDPVPGWLAQTCSDFPGVVQGEGVEGEDPCEGVSTDNIGDAVPICVDGQTYQFLADQDEDGPDASDFVEMVNDEETGHSAALGACASSSPAPPPPAREAYCSVGGNTNPFTGDPIPAGTFLNLLAGQPNSDKHYTGDVPAWYVQGVGLTCSLTPAQASLAAASTQRVGAAGDPEIPIPGIPDYAIYTFVPAP